MDEVGARARRRRSPWNLLLIPGGLISFATLWVGSIVLLGRLYAWRHEGSVVTVLPDNLAGSLMALAAFFMWIAPALVLGNCLVWLVPAARRVLDDEARSHPGTSFLESNRDLIRLALWVAPPTGALALAVALI